MITVLGPSGLGGETVVTVSGVLDVVSSPGLAVSALRALDSGAASLVIDLRGVTSIDPTGAGTLLRVHHRSAVIGTAVHVVLTSPLAAEQLRHTGLAGRLHVVPDLNWFRHCCQEMQAGLSSTALAG